MKFLAKVLLTVALTLAHCAHASNMQLTQEDDIADMMDMWMGSSDVKPKKTPTPSTESPEEKSVPAPTFDELKAGLAQYFECPITKDIMLDPVITADGHSYEAKAITQWLQNSDKSPATGLHLDNKDTVPNHALRNAIQEESAVKAGLAGCFICSITQVVMFDPVITADGHSYEATAITQWLQNSDKSPLTRLRLDNTNTVQNHALRDAIQEYIKTVPMEDRPEAFQPFVGVEVTGAGEPYVNGLYHLREMEDKRMPPQYLDDFEQWVKFTGGRPWYEKNEDQNPNSGPCYIHYHSDWKMWFFCDGHGYVRYEESKMGESDLPPLASCNWQSPYCPVKSRRSKYPYPTLRVVS